MALSRPDELALRDLATGRQWTFRQLNDEADRAGKDEPGPAFPQGINANFILSVLRAWRDQRPVCPLEVDQSRPVLGTGLPDGIVHLKTTSATSGDPRLVAFTASQLIADAENIVGTMGLRPDWPNLGVISLAHSYGFSNLVLPLLLHGIPLILGGAPLPELIRRAASSVPAITLPAVPALWRTWHEAGSLPENIRLAISAGAPLPLELEQTVFKLCGIKIHNFYGSSECGGIAYDAEPRPRTEAACAGAPMRGVNLRVGPNQCLEIRSRAVAETYWPLPASILGGGVFRTSDLAELRLGKVFLRGRAGDLINIAGRKVSPETIEKALLNHPEVRECLVFGVPSADSKRGETIVACVVAGTRVASDTLKQYLQARLPAWQVPRDWWLVESLFTSHRGKISRAEWRQRYLATVDAPALSLGIGNGGVTVSDGGSDI